MVQRRIRGWLDRQKVKRLLEKEAIRKKLEEIRLRLLWSKFKGFWKRKRGVFAVIRRKYARYNAA